MAAANPTAPQYGQNQGQTSTSGNKDSSSFSTPSAPRTIANEYGSSNNHTSSNGNSNIIGGSGTWSANTPVGRSTSPVKPSEAPKPVNVVKNDRPIDIRAEEDAARRYNIGRVLGNNRYGAVSRGKRTDLFGPELKMKLERMAKDHQLTFDEDAMAYLSMAAETRLRDILTSSISAQQHRTTTSYLHPPPTASGSTAGSGKGGKGKERAMWAVSINSDPNALLEVLNKQAKEAERDFRTSRMTRLAREHEIERIKERQNPGETPQETGQNSNAPTNGDESAQPTTSTSANASSPERAQSPLPPTNATPTFGGVSAKKSSKNKKTATFSPDVQIKMSNATAMRSTGMGKKYSWMMGSAPNISSPLSGKKKGKKGQAAQGQGQDEGGDVEAGEEQMLGGGEEGMSKKRKTSNLSHEMGGGESSGKRAKKRKMPSLPSRRMVPVSVPGPIPGPNPGPTPGSNQGLGGNEKMVPDDRCLTISDFVFALERDGAGKGMGTGDEIVRRAMARPGGPWGVAQARKP